MTNTPDGSISILDIKKRGRVSAKLGKMRKPQEFVVYPVKEGERTITVQSDKSIGRFDTVTGKGVLNTRGQYFVHLAVAQPFEFPKEFVHQCLVLAGLITEKPEGTDEVVVEPKEEV